MEKEKKRWKDEKKLMEQGNWKTKKEKARKERWTNKPAHENWQNIPLEIFFILQGSRSPRVSKRMTPKYIEEEED